MEIAYTVLATIVIIYFIGFVATLLMLRADDHRITPRDVLFCMFAWYIMLPFLIVIRVFIGMVTPEYMRKKRKF